MASFPRATGMTRGYSRPQVDRFLGSVREALDAGSGAVSAADVRRAGFDLVRGGYDVAAVDAHLDVLELRALAQERAAVPGARTGDDDLGPVVPAELLDAVEAAPGQRFRRTTGLRRGYAPREVDAFLDALAATLDGAPVPGGPSDAEDVRRAVFHVRWRGYDEAEVDDALDLAVDLLLRRERLAGAGRTAPVPASGTAEGAPVGPLPDDTAVLDARADRVS